MCLLCVCVSDRLEKEREILEERAEKRVEILKNLVSKTVDLSAVNTDNSKVMTNAWFTNAVRVLLVINNIIDDDWLLGGAGGSVGGNHQLTD